MNTTVLDLYSDMVRVRRMEEKAAELYGEAKIRGFLHLYVGEEAVAAGSLRALKAEDAVVATYREHAHALLHGVSMKSIMAEMSLNMAVLWQLPILFCCENNRYAMGTALDRAQSQTDLTAKAASYRVPTAAVDGMDAEGCLAVARDGAEHVRHTGGPFFVEFRTYRFRAHSMFDPELYRDKAEVEQWRLRDPIRLLADRYPDELGGERIAAVQAAADEEVAAAVAFAEAGTWEPVADLDRDVLTGVKL